MGSYSVSLDRTREKKMDVLKESTPRFKGKANLDVCNILIFEILDPIVLKEE